MCGCLGYTCEIINLVRVALANALCVASTCEDEEKKTRHQLGSLHGNSLAICQLSNRERTLVSVLEDISQACPKGQCSHVEGSVQEQLREMRSLNAYLMQGLFRAACLCCFVITASHHYKGHHYSKQ